MQYCQNLHDKKQPKHVDLRFPSFVYINKNVTKFDESFSSGMTRSKSHPRDMTDYRDANPKTWHAASQSPAKHKSDPPPAREHQTSTSVERQSDTRPAPFQHKPPHRFSLKWHSCARCNLSHHKTMIPEVVNTTPEKPRYLMLMATGVTLRQLSHAFAAHCCPILVIHTLSI